MLNKYKDLLKVLLDSNQSTILFVLLSIMVILMLTISIKFIKTFSFKNTFEASRRGILNSYNILDKKAQDNLISRLRLSSSESDYRVKLPFFVKLDLKLIERSNIRQYIPFFNIYILLLFIIGIFVFFISPMNLIFDYLPTSMVASAFISLIPIILLDTLSSLNESNSRKSTANFLSELSTWLDIKNDLIFAIDNSIANVEGPLMHHLEEAVAQLRSGVKEEEVFDILAYKINTEQFYIISKNFKSVLKNGGDIVGLVKDLEEEAYKIDIEMNHRITDMLMTRVTLNVILLLASIFIIASVSLSTTLKEIYTNTQNGKNVMFFAIVIFVIGIAMNAMSTKEEF